MVALKSWIPKDETKLKPKRGRWSMHSIFLSGLTVFCVGMLLFFGSGDCLKLKMFGYGTVIVGCAAIITKEVLHITGLLEKLDERKTDSSGNECRDDETPADGEMLHRHVRR